MAAGDPPRLRVAVLVDYFLPGYRSGGPVRAIAGLVDALGETFDFHVLCRDHDYLSDVRYGGIRTGVPVLVGSTRVTYLSRASRRPWWMLRFLRQEAPDVLYLNSLYSVTFTIVPLLLRRLRLIGDMPIVLHPRGQLAKSALALKPRKKAMFLQVAKWLGLFTGVTWQASGERDRSDIVRRFGDGVEIRSVPDLQIPLQQMPGEQARAVKSPGEVRLVLLGRISPMKNLDWALELLSEVRGNVTFTVYGPVDDEAHWRHCQSLVRQLPPNIRFEYGGAVTPEEVPDALTRHHVLFLPTRGENYGHAIVEGLMAGLPVLISDQTQWRALERHGVGWDLPLDDRAEFVNVIERCVLMGRDEYVEISQRAGRFGRAIALSAQTRADTEALFRSVIESTRAE